MTNIQKILLSYADCEYKEFVLKLTPGLDKDSVIGVRAPYLRQLAKSLDKKAADGFLDSLPHKYYEENNLHSILLSRIKDEKECIDRLSSFLPYINNWATCDIISPAVFKKHKDALLVKTKEWIKSDEVYTVRFGVGMLMKYFLDADFKPEYNVLVSEIKSDEYYINMMCAWYFATALAKQYDDTLPYFVQRKMTVPVHKAAVKKACESYRITDAQKEYLRKM